LDNERRGMGKKGGFGKADANIIETRRAKIARLMGN
jgi:hypothetical protein